MTRFDHLWSICSCYLGWFPPITFAKWKLAPQIAVNPGYHCGSWVISSHCKPSKCVHGTIQTRQWTRLHIALFHLQRTRRIWQDGNAEPLFVFKTPFASFSFRMNMNALEVIGLYRHDGYAVQTPHVLNIVWNFIPDVISIQPNRNLPNTVCHLELPDYCNPWCKTQGNMS